jgi:hypothetical protein
MTLQTIIAAVRERLDDPTFDNVKITRWANWVIYDICSRTNFPFLENSTTVSTIVSTQDYTLASIAADLNKVKSVIDTTNERELTYVKPEELDSKYKDMSNDTTGQPIYWTVYGDTLRVYPLPDDVYTLQVRYKANPTELTVASDTAIIPEVYSETVILGIYQKSLEWNDDFDYSVVIEKQYEQKVNKMVSDYSNRVSGQPDIIAWDRPEI